MGRLHVVTEVPPDETPGPDAGAPDAAPAPQTADAALVRPDAAPPDVPASGCPSEIPSRVADLSVPAAGLEAERAQVRFTEPQGTAFLGTERYEVRVWEGSEATPDAFSSGTPADPPSPQTPGAVVTLQIGDLKAQRSYTVGVRPVGTCLDGAIAYAGFTTLARKFAQLSGCFIATAAYGTAQAPAVVALRRVRDRARATSALGAAAAALYQRASPPLAEAVRASELARALVRGALAPLVQPLAASGPAGVRPPAPAGTP
jgi:hypothetical protein